MKKRELVLLSEALGVARMAAYKAYKDRLEAFEGDFLNADHGTCNFDRPQLLINIPMTSEDRDILDVRERNRIGTHDFACPLDGQGAMRTIMAEAAVKAFNAWVELKDVQDKFQATMYYRMD
jgi:hypothetical protein